MMFKCASVVALLSIACCLQAQTTPPFPSKATIHESVTLPIPPSKTASTKHRVDGPVRLVALYTNPAIAAVLFTVDGKAVGSVNEKPFTYVWNPATTGPGEHIAAWSAADKDRKELAAGAITLVVGGVRPLPTPASPVQAELPGVVNYSNDKLGISLVHPAGWTVKREFKDLPTEWTDAFWLILSTDPVAKAANVINLRHYLDTKEQVPDDFAKTNPYVTSWQRINITGHPAFTTTQGQESSKRVVHRVIILAGRHVLMLNMIDTSGKPSSESKNLFMQVARSISVTDKPGASSEEKR